MARMTKPVPAQVDEPLEVEDALDAMDGDEGDWDEAGEALEEEELEVIYVGRRHRDDDSEAEVEPIVYADRPNKSAGKRAMQELQKLSDRLLELGPHKWQSLGLSDALQQALKEGCRLTHPNAKRRHQRFLAKLLSLEEQEAALDLVQTLDAKHQAENLHFHRLEQWRDRLLTEGDAALAELLDEYPNADRQALRQLMLKARKEADAGKPPAAARKLFKALRALAESVAKEDLAETWQVNGPD